MDFYSMFLISEHPHKIKTQQTKVWKVKNVAKVKIDV